MASFSRSKGLYVDSLHSHGVIVLERKEAWNEDRARAVRHSSLLLSWMPAQPSAPPTVPNLVLKSKFVARQTGSSSPG